jgi:hypothetical protein
MEIKKLMATHQNIAEHSGSVWLHTGTNGNKNGGKLTTGRHSTCINVLMPWAPGAKRKVKSFPRCLKNKVISLVV